MNSGINNTKETEYNIQHITFIHFYCTIHHWSVLIAVTFMCYFVIATALMVVFMYSLVCIFC